MSENFDKEFGLTEEEIAEGEAELNGETSDVPAEIAEELEKEETE